MELSSKFFKSDSPIRKVLIEVLSASFNYSSLDFIPLSDTSGPEWLTNTS